MKATGILAHHFWGEYSAGIGLQFECAESAQACLPLLADLGFKLSNKIPEAMGAWLNSEQLNTFKERLRKWNLQILPCRFDDCRTQCADAEIDSLNHSIDYGPNWTVDIPGEPINQMHLFQEANHV